MYLKYTKIVNKKGQAVLVGCDRMWLYVNLQFIFIYLEYKIKILGKTSLRFSLRFSMRKKSSLRISMGISMRSCPRSWFLMRFLMRFSIFNEVLAQDLIEILILEQISLRFSMRKKHFFRKGISNKIPEEIIYIRWISRINLLIWYKNYSERTRLKGNKSVF